MDTDPMLQVAREENMKLQARVERHRDDLCEARKCIADIRALLHDGLSLKTVLCNIKERLDEYAGM